EPLPARHTIAPTLPKTSEKPCARRLWGACDFLPVRGEYRAFPEVLRPLTRPRRAGPGVPSCPPSRKPPRHQAAPPRCLWINSSSRALGQGVTLCEQEDAARGMLWLARGLEITPDEDADLQQVLRINLAGWRRQVHPLRAAFSFQGQE